MSSQMIWLEILNQKRDDKRRNRQTKKQTNYLDQLCIEIRPPYRVEINRVFVFMFLILNYSDLRIFFLFYFNDVVMILRVSYFVSAQSAHS